MTSEERGGAMQRHPGHKRLTRAHAVHIRPPQKHPGTGKAGIIIFLLLFAAVLCIAAYSYLKSRDIEPGSTGFSSIISGILPQKGIPGELPVIGEIPDEPGYSSIFRTYDGYLARGSRDDITLLDGKGVRQFDFHVTIGNPVLKTSGNYLLAADIGGNCAYVINGGRIIWSRKFDRSIINADISDDGYVSVILPAKGFKASVQVFDARSTADDSPAMFIRNIAESFVLGADVVSSGRQVVICRADATGVTVVSSLEFSRLDSEKPFAVITKPGFLLPSLRPFRDGSLLAAGDSLAVYCDRNGNEKWTRDYSDGRIFCSGVCMGRYAVLAVDSGKNVENGGTGRFHTLVIEPSGRQRADYAVDSAIKGMDAFGDRIALNTGNTACFTDINGKDRGRYASKSEIRNIYLFDRRKAAVITAKGAVILKLKG